MLGINFLWMKAVSFLSRQRGRGVGGRERGGGGKMLSRDKVRFKGTGTSQGLQGRDSSLTTFTFSVFRERDNLLWDEKRRREEKKKQDGEKRWKVGSGHACV